MLPEQYQELNELKTFLNLKRKQKLANTLKIRELRNQVGPLRAELLEELSQKRHYMEIDKELRSLHEITNQTDWKRKIKELTREDEERIEAATREYEEKIEALSDENDVIRIRITDTEWELRLKTEYYSHNQGELLDLTSPIKEVN